MNQREIRFRAWDKKNNCWQYQGYPIGEVAANGYELDGLELEWTQFTGLKDCKGREIYEGDVVRQDDEVASVYFDEGAFMLNLGRSYDNCNLWAWANENRKRLEVIGSVYEQPELLKPEQVAA